MSHVIVAITLAIPSVVLLEFFLGFLGFDGSINTGLTIRTGRLGHGSDWLRDHVVGEATILPATGFLALCIATGATALLFGQPPVAALAIGSALALSSTAFVLPTLAERRELSTRYGRDAFAILLFQDLSVIPLLALIPLFGTGRSTALTHPGVGLGVLVVVAMIGRPLLNALFRHVARVDSREMFTAAALVTVLGLALLMQAGGLSMSLGAFVAGVLLADSEFRHELEASIAPFQGLLLGLFFMAVGMSTNLSLLVKFPLQILGLTAGLVTIKFITLYGLRRLLGGVKAEARLLALALAQGGEFAFVLFYAAQSFRVLGEVQADKLTLVVALSMAVSPLLLLIGDFLVRADAAKQPPRAFDEMPAEASEVVIAGFGRVGQVVGRLLLARGTRFTALDVDAEQVETVRRFGLKVFYGDAANLDLLHAAQLREAKVFVLAIDDVKASLRTAELVRKHFPHVQIVARARNRFHASRLMDLGIERQIREALPSSLEMARWTLELLHEPPALVDQMVTRFVRHDAEVLARQQAIAHDEGQMIQSTRAAREELAQILEEARAAFSHKERGVKR